MSKQQYNKLLLRGVLHSAANQFTIPDMKTFRDIIAAWPKPSLKTFADDLGIRYGTVQLMNFRCSIGPRHWPAVEAAARRRKIKGVTVALMADMYISDNGRSREFDRRQQSQRVA